MGQDNRIYMRDAIGSKIDDFYKNIRMRMAQIGSEEIAPQTIQSIEKNKSIVRLINFSTGEPKAGAFWCDDYPGNNFWMLTFESKVLTDLHPISALNSLGEVQIDG